VLKVQKPKVKVVEPGRKVVSDWVGFSTFVVVYTVCSFLEI